MNSNDILNSIGLLQNQKDYTFQQQPNYIACIQIELGQDENYLLDIKQKDHPRTLAQQFCTKHQLNRLAVKIVEDKIKEAIKKAKIKNLKIQNKNELNIQQYQNSISQINQFEQQKQLNHKKSLISDKPLQKSQSNQNKNSLNQQLNPRGSLNSNKPKRHPCRQVQDNLYFKGLINAKRTQEKINHIKEQKNKQEMKEVTFKPTINLVSQKIVEFRKQSGVKKEKKKTSPPPKIVEQMKNCTFKPKINKVSELIIQNRNTRKQQMNHFEALYQDRLKKNCKRSEQENQKQLFKPKINQKSFQNIRQPFLVRVQLALEKKNNFKEQINYEQHSFQPKICRPPKFQRNKQSVPVWDYLYQLSSKQSHNIQKVTQNKVTNKNSIQYYENKVQHKIEEIFNLLDDDQDGIISPQLIGIQKLSKVQLTFLKPFLIQMDQASAEINFSQFRKALLILLEESDIISKGNFLSQKRKKSNTSQTSFRPSINTKSKQILQHKRSNDIHLNLYQQGLKQAYDKEIKIQLAKAKRQQQQLEQCTFTPQISRSSKHYIQKILSRKNFKNTNSMIDLTHTVM